MPENDHAYDPPITERITCMYYKARITENHPFDRFSNLWTSFNAFYAYKFGDAINGNRNSDRYLLTEFCKETQYEEIYKNLLANSESFKRNLNDFMKILNKTRFPGKIRDLRPHNRTNESAAKPFTSTENFKEFILITYQIRNNLIHGNKSNRNDADIEIIKTIFNAFIEFSGEIYKQEGIID